MTTRESSITYCESAERVGNSRLSSVRDDVLVTEIGAKEQLAAGWDNIVDDKLIEWAVTRGEFEAEGLIGPSSEAISCAFRFAAFMRKHDFPLPTGLIPDGEGGIVFENRSGPSYQRIEIDQQGRACLATFLCYELLERVPIDIE